MNANTGISPLPVALHTTRTPIVPSPGTPHAHTPRTMKQTLLPLLVIGAVTTLCCAPPAAEGPTSLTQVPAWSEEAIWYQIFVERFRNGDPSNDPSPEDIRGAWRDGVPENWRPTPWNHDWYQQEDWAKASGRDFYDTVQMRRYGGDLQGVLEQLDYLNDLGVTALYLNPINDAPSLHKYDARNYRHVDRNFGPDPQGDAAIMASEDPIDPSTWQWTAADRLFLQLVEAVHDRGMRIILDYSWNHTGITFWAWKDILDKQQDSPFTNWYTINRFDDPGTPDDEFEYEGWAGVRTLPNLRKVDLADGSHPEVLEGNLDPHVKRHVLNVTRRWLDPNGDGDPSDGVDGFRLDVAKEVPLGFWREYRIFVRNINPEAYLVGEVWWEEWPDQMADPLPWVRGDVFDAVMHYRWYMPTRSFFASAPPYLTATEYVAHLDSIEAGIDRPRLNAMMNLAASHDSPRVATSLYNNQTKYKYQAGARGNPDYKIDQPDDVTRAVQRLLLTQQFTYVGSPHIWNGDEVGMWGTDDPDCRKPLVWADLDYEDERATPHGENRPPDRVAPDTLLFDFYRTLAHLRRDHVELFAHGDLTYHLVDDERRLLAYARTRGASMALVVFNASREPRQVSIPVDGEGSFEDALVPGAPVLPGSGAITLELPPLTAKVLMRS